MTNRQFWTGIVVLWIVVIIISFFLGRDFQFAIWTGLVVSALWFTVDRLINDIDKNVADQQHLRDLIREMGSRDNGTAIRAVENLRNIGSLTDGMLNSRNFRGADLRKAPLEGAQLLGAHFESCDLGNAHFEHANLHGAFFQKADLSGAYFNSAPLSDAHFEGSNLGGAHIEGAMFISEAFFDENTTLPNFKKWKPGTDMSEFTKVIIKGFK